MFQDPQDVINDGIFDDFHQFWTGIFGNILLFLGILQILTFSMVLTPNYSWG